MRRWLVLLVILLGSGLCAGCSAFLEDYNYNPIGSGYGSNY